MANTKRIEALADGIAFLNRMHDPASDAYQLRNPGLLRAYTYRHLGSVDNTGRRIFTSLIAGYRCLIDDLEKKCSGQTRGKGYNGKLRSHDKLLDLLKTFKLDNTDDGHIFTLLDFLDKALPGQDVSAQTQLSFFLEDKES